MGYNIYERILGSLLGAAIGDAMGAATEGRSIRQIEEYFGHRVTDFETTPEDTFGCGNKPGHVTDDFSSAYFLAQSIVANGGKVEEDVVKEGLIEWSDHSVFFDRFAGPTTRAAIRRMKGDKIEEESGIKISTRQATNGASMRISPIGMLNPGNLEAALEDAIKVTRLTHDNYLAISGACAIACAVSEALREEADIYSVLQAALWGAREGEKRGRAVSANIAGPSVVKRLEYAIKIATEKKDAESKTLRISEEIGCGLHISEAVPASIAIFASCEDALNTIICAVNAGYDTDTVATMTGALAGALYGVSAFPKHYIGIIDEVNGFSLESLAAAITKIAKKRVSKSKPLEENVNSKILGCILGAACADAMGAATENRSTEQIKEIFKERVKDYKTPPEGSLAYGRKKGQVTDAFSISYILGKHLQAAKGRASTQLGVEALKEWGESEWFEPFAGMTTRKVINRLKQESKIGSWAYSGILGSKLFKGHYYALSSNGAATKAYIAALYNPGNIDKTIEDTLRLTLASHDDVYSVSGACAVSAAVSQALKSKSSLYSVIQAALYGAFKGEELARADKNILDYPGASVLKRIYMAINIGICAGDGGADKVRAIIGCGPAIAETVPAALALLIMHRGDLRKSIEDAVNLGDETSAIASITGQIAGALNGDLAFSKEEIEFLNSANGFDLEEFAKGFYQD